MTTKQIRGFNPNIHPEFAKASLNTRLVSSDGSPEKLIQLAKSFIRGNKIGYRMVWIAFLAMIIMEIPGCLVLAYRLYGSSPSPNEILIIFWILAITLLVIMFGTLMQEARHGTIERSFLHRMLDLQEAYGGPLDFSNWGWVKRDLESELVIRASNVLSIEDNRVKRWEEFKQAAHSSFKSFLGLCQNFENLADPFEGPYYDKARVLLGKE